MNTPIKTASTSLLPINKMGAYDAAAHYCRVGFAPIPVPLASKQPVEPDWQNMRLTEETCSSKFDPGGGNVGILLGAASGDLVDVDLDFPEAVQLAEHFLEPTLTFGRRSKPKSHYLYKVTPVPEKTRRIQMPGEAGGTVAEIRSNGTQTVFPPSQHTSHEFIRFTQDGEHDYPVPIEAFELERRVNRLAAAAILARLWQNADGRRNDAALAVAGGLLRGGWPATEAQAFIAAFTVVANDPDWEKHVTSVQYTAEKLDAGEIATGWPTAAELLGEKEIQKVRELLGMSGGDRSSPVTTAPKAQQGKLCTIETQDGCLIKCKTDAAGEVIPTVITSFTMRPVEAVQLPGQGETLTVELTSISGKKMTVQFPPEAWLSNQHFIRHLPSKEFVFTGSSTDVQLIRHHMAQFAIPERQGVEVAGFHKGRFVTEEGALTADGINQDFVLVGKGATRCMLVNTLPANDEDLAALRALIDKFNIPQVAMPALGWTIACFFKPLIHERLGHFPLLGLEGEPGSGKTSTKRNILMAVWGLTGNPHSIAQQTRFTLASQLSSTNAIPQFFDEYKTSKMPEKQVAEISDTIRNVYDGNEAQRGRQDQSVTRYLLQAPMVIAGETGFVEPAALDRFVTCRFSKQDSGPYKSDFIALSSLPLTRLGRTILDKALRMTEAEVNKKLDAALSAVDPRLEDRPRHNAAVSRFGLLVLGEVLNREFDGLAIDQAVIDAVLEDGHARKSNVDMIIEAMGQISQVKKFEKRHQQFAPGAFPIAGNEYVYADHLEKGVHYDVVKGELILRPQECYSILRKWIGPHGFDGEILPDRSFYSQLRREPYFLSKTTRSVGGTDRSVVVLDIQKMITKGLNLPTEWRR